MPIQKHKDSLKFIAKIKKMMDNLEVRKRLPHREPFLFIDEVLEVNDEFIVAKRFVSPDEDFFKGHFPNFPIMPGVLVLEAMAQSCALLGCIL